LFGANNYSSSAQGSHRPAEATSAVSGQKTLVSLESVTLRPHAHGLFSHRLLNSSGSAQERGSAQVTKVSRSTISNTSARQIAIKPLSPPTRAAARGVTAFEFVGRVEPRPCCSSPPSSSASGASPRDALLPVFLRIKRAATAKVFQRIAARLAHGRLTAPRVGAVPAVPEGFASKHVKSRLREAPSRGLPRVQIAKSKTKLKWAEVSQ
jgi:hypothetical protein